MKVKELIERLKECEQDSLIQFYFLKDYDLSNCKLETILQADGQTEITVVIGNTTWKLMKGNMTCIK